MPAENDLLEQAQAIDRALQVIHHELRRPIERDMNRAPVTVPQMRALDMLTKPENLGGMTLKELTRAMGLSQSTVSGIVDRLERMDFVQRKTDPNDRRVTRIEANERVKSYVQEEVVASRLSPLLNALEKASSAERELIRQGIKTLERLLT